LILADFLLPVVYISGAYTGDFFSTFGATDVTTGIFWASSFLQIKLFFKNATLKRLYV
jgi:hypothetical protein